MNEAVGEKISVISVFDAQKGNIMPRKIMWHNREYIMSKLGYHHCVREGRVLFHIFHVTDGSTAFRLSLNTETLHWTLEEVYDESAT